MNPVSVVIITRNEENNIVDCIRSARLVSDDIIIVDALSADDTVRLAENEGARVYSVDWKGYGYARNYGAAHAKHNWILALDADERMTPVLTATIARQALNDPTTIYCFKRVNYLGERRIRYGTLGFETVKRIYNRRHCSWDLTLVHERLTGAQAIRKIIPGHIAHYGLKNLEDYRNKAVVYAQMSAEKYLLEGKRNNWIKRLGSPLFNSVKSYVFQLGFLDGKQGFQIASIIAYYTWLKYDCLQTLISEANALPQTETEVSFSPARKIEAASNSTFS